MKEAAKPDTLLLRSPNINGKKISGNTSMHEHKIEQKAVTRSCLSLGGESFLVRVKYKLRGEFILRIDP